MGSDETDMHSGADAVPADSVERPLSAAPAGTVPTLDLTTTAAIPVSELIRPTRRGVRWNADGVAAVTVFSANATSVELCLLDDDDPTWVSRSVGLTRRPGSDEWSCTVADLVPGTKYGFRVAGEGGRFAPDRVLLDPYATGIAHYGHEWQSVALAPDGFDWGAGERPGTPLDYSVIYEAHVKGLTRQNHDLPAEIRGTYAALGHPATIGYLRDLGVTALELLPIHAFATEHRLRSLGLANYWGYNTVAYFAPHPRYATAEAQAAGAAAVNAELKSAIRALHEAGIEVILDVVYNHTAEEGISGPTLSFRGIDDETYYRHDSRGNYVDMTGCGNTVDFGKLAPQQLVLDSLRHWVSEYRIDGFRFDLAATLGRGGDGHFDATHPLLAAIVNDPALRDTKMIAEPWDVGMGGWQSGSFPRPWSEWNDHFRDTARTFWLTDAAAARRRGAPSGSIGALADTLAGSARVYAQERGPLASINFVTAHDGFTLHDVVSYSTKRNHGNGEGNRDGTDANHSYNFGVEGPSSNPSIAAERRKAMRNLMATLMFSAGIPMISMGDEVARSQQGNNNAYCHDSPLTWLSWQTTRVQADLYATLSLLTRLRRENPAVRPFRYGVLGQTTPSASQMEWFNIFGEPMSIDDWNNSGVRTLQFFAASTPEVEQFNQVLIAIHGDNTATHITLPHVEGVSRYRMRWNSAWESPELGREKIYAPGDIVTLTANSTRFFTAETAAESEPHDDQLA